MKASIIAVGTELLFGQIVNTNAAYLSEQLNLIGIDTMYHYVVGDNPDRLRCTIEYAFKDTDLVILTGGLGPTQDDLTKEVVAEYFGRDIVRDPDCLEELMQFFAIRNRKMAENNLKQADIPEGATVFHNDRGTAPGFAIEEDGKCAICLPGPPWEMQGMFDKSVRTYLMNFVDDYMYYKTVRTIGIGESDLEMLLMPLIDGQTDPTIATYAKEGEVSFRIASKRPTVEEAEAAVKRIIDEASGLASRYIYSIDNEELNEVVVHKLKDRGLILTSAESCTGGLFASSITDVSGASEVYRRGYVTYDAEAKIDMLGVNPDTIMKYSVVSSEVAVEMARGALNRSGADMAVAVTGYAGPSADEGREPGNAYIGYAYKGGFGSVEINTKRADRYWNRNYFRLNMLKVVNEMIGKLDAEAEADV